MEKRVVLGTSMVLLAIAIVGFVIYLIFYHEFDTPVKENENEVTALTPYGQALSGLGTYAQWNATWEKILNSDTAYLQDPDFDVTADNFYQSVHDLLAAPARLYFFSTDDPEGGSYKCDSPEINVKFADAFQDVTLSECSEEEYDALAGTEYNTHVGFHNVAGGAGVLCYHDYSCITLGRYNINTNLSTREYFYAEENLRDKLMSACGKVLPYAMKAPARETE
jgi:hypothetical protein